MTCELIRAADGSTTFMCSRGKRKPEPTCEVDGCGAMATNLCDGETGPIDEPVQLELIDRAGGKSCDKRLCDFHSTQPPGTAGLDYCPECAVRAGLEPGPTVREESLPVQSDRWRRERDGVEAEVIPLDVPQAPSKK
jgi:hypothetical protein